jgi:hypothetical protein
VAGRDTIRAAGKDVVDAPRLLWNTSARWTRGGGFVTGAARYVDERFFSITNDLARAGDRAAGSRASRSSTRGSDGASATSSGCAS